MGSKKKVFKKAQICFEVKDPDGCHELAEKLGLSDAVRRRHFEWGEYCTLEVNVSEDMTFTGRFLEVGRG